MPGMERLNLVFAKVSHKLEIKKKLDCLLDSLTLNGKEDKLEHETENRLLTHLSVYRHCST